MAIHSIAAGIHRRFAHVANLQERRKAKWIGIYGGRSVERMKIEKPSRTTTGLTPNQSRGPIIEPNIKHHKRYNLKLSTHLQYDPIV